MMLMVSFGKKLWIASTTLTPLTFLVVKKEIFPPSLKGFYGLLYLPKWGINGDLGMVGLVPGLGVVPCS
jgi:hypothetical protein